MKYTILYICLSWLTGSSLSLPLTRALLAGVNTGIDAIQNLATGTILNVHDGVYDTVAGTARTISNINKAIDFPFGGPPPDPPYIPIRQRQAMVMAASNAAMMGGSPNGMAGGMMGGSPNGMAGGMMGGSPNGMAGGIMGGLPNGMAGGMMGSSPNGMAGGMMGSSPNGPSGSLGGAMAANPNGMANSPGNTMDGSMQAPPSSMGTMGPMASMGPMSMTSQTLGTMNSNPMMGRSLMFNSQMRVSPFLNFKESEKNSP